MGEGGGGGGEGGKKDVQDRSLNVFFFSVHLYAESFSWLVVVESTI